jgi:hypothetical protein
MPSTVQTPVDFGTFASEGMVLALSGLLAGCIIDAFFVRLVAGVGDDALVFKLVALFAQLLVGLVVMYVVWRQQPSFATRWYRTIPGLAFPAMYFGVQSNVYAIAQALYK